MRTGVEGYGVVVWFGQYTDIAFLVLLFWFYPAYTVRHSFTTFSPRIERLFSPPPRVLHTDFTCCCCRMACCNAVLIVYVCGTQCLLGLSHLRLRNMFAFISFLASGRPYKSNIPSTILIHFCSYFRRFLRYWMQIMAGLLDQSQLAQSELAHSMVLKMADWVVRNVNSAKVQDEGLWQAVLDTEWGGMNEVLFNLYAATGNAS